MKRFRSLLAATTILTLGSALSASAAPVFTTLYSFPAYAGNTFGISPEAGLWTDKAGNLYGTASQGGKNADGTIFELTPPAAAKATWKPKLLSLFKGGKDGASPKGGLLPDSASGFYGTTGNAFGTVYHLLPPASGATAWTRNSYAFKAIPDGNFPFGKPIADAAGNLYVTTSGGGTKNFGTIVQLKPPLTGGTTWTESVIYQFQGGTIGYYPTSDLVIDANGALFGTTYDLPGTTTGKGTVFKLTFNSSTGNWVYSFIYGFRGGTDGANPYAGLMIDKTGHGSYEPAGAMYGVTESGGNGAGTVFEITPPSAAYPAWSETVIYSFVASTDGAQPDGRLIMDDKGNLYGTTYQQGGIDSHGNITRRGTVFKLSPPTPGQYAWTYTVLHAFTGSGTDGSNPRGQLLFDPNSAPFSTLLGTTEAGGANGTGTIFKLTL